MAYAANNGHDNPTECPNEAQIIAYARSRGLGNPRLTNEGVSGWHLVGIEQVPGQIRSITEELNINFGGGHAGWHQVMPQNFILPSSRADEAIEIPAESPSI